DPSPSVWPSPRQIASVPVHRFLRALPHLDVYALCFSRADSRQRVLARTAFASLSVRRAFAWHPDLQQGFVAGGSDAARFSSHPAQRLFLRLYLPARNHPDTPVSAQLSDSCYVLHQHHTRNHSSWRRHPSPLEGWPRALHFG